MTDRIAQRGVEREGCGASGGADQPLDEAGLRSQNAAFRGTGGVSRNNRGSGFQAAYQNTETGEAVVSRFADGRPAPIHLLEGLPDAWVAARDAEGCACEAIAGVTAGFLHDGDFYTREDAARCLAEQFTGQPPCARTPAV